MKQTIQSIHNNYGIINTSIKFSVIQQYSKATKQWKFHGFRCLHCENTFKSASRIEKHHEVCKEINTIKKRKDLEMPIQVVTIKGERYYKWGDTGKPYKNRADAEKQASAAYASGYKEKKEADKK